MGAKDILNLFELIKDAPEEHWEYNKGRLLEILLDYESKIGDVQIADGNITNISRITEKVIRSLEKINMTNSLDDILIYPEVRNRFQEKLSHHLKENQRIHCKTVGISVLPVRRFQKTI